MPSKITLSDTEKNSIMNQFIQQLAESLNGNFENTKQITFKIPALEIITNKQKPKIIITTTAGLKMSELVRNCTGEVGWHGIVERPDTHTFIITDILVYPQTVSGTTVVTDETEYAIWLSTLSTPTIKNMRFQGHSHVNMACNPSSTDLDLYNKYLANLKQDDYYIFFICNKKGAINVILYDLKTNIKYNTADIDIIKETDMSEWYDSIKENIKTPKPVTTNNSTKTYNQADYGIGDDGPYSMYPGYYEGPYSRSYDSFQDSWDQRVEKVSKTSKTNKTSKTSKTSKTNKGEKK